MSRCPAFLLTLLLLPALCRGQVLGTVGLTYPIAERDALQELEGQARRVDWQSLLAGIRPEKFRPEGLPSLPAAGKNRKFSVDPAYTLTMDIPDGKGGILYPRGYAFNPLDYVPFPKTLVILDGGARDQLAWFAGSPYRDRRDVMLLVAGEGVAAEIGREFRRTAYYLTASIRERFRLAALPAIVTAPGRMIQVEEVAVRPGLKR